MALHILIIDDAILVAWGLLDVMKLQKYFSVFVDYGLPMYFICSVAAAMIGSY